MAGDPPWRDPGFNEALGVACGRVRRLGLVAVLDHGEGDAELSVRGDVIDASGIA